MDLVIKRFYFALCAHVMFASGIVIHDLPACHLDSSRIDPVNFEVPSHVWAKWDDGKFYPFHVVKRFDSVQEAKSQTDQLCCDLNQLDESSTSTEEGLLCCLCTEQNPPFPYPEEAVMSGTVRTAAKRSTVQP